VKTEIILVLGGARSGKSRFAQKLASDLGQKVLYVAPLVPRDEEMRRRVELHRKSRPSAWRTVEAPTGVAKALREHIADAEVVLLDCLTLLVANLMSPSHDTTEIENVDYEAAQREMSTELEALLGCIEGSSTSLIIVSNEVGAGLVPPYPSGRAFRDLLGEANQFIAERVDKVYMMIAGIPLELKTLSTRDEK
jgi:adenosylcobinamide kinase/adenosylcobinamide-phosphate guanylyltransferase